MSLLEVRDLRVELEGTALDIVSDVSFTIDAGEVVGLVGESGSGKTTIGTAVLGFARRGAVITSGEIMVDGVDVLALSDKELQRARGKLVAYIPQDPGAALNPARRLIRQLGETLEVHAPKLTAQERLARIQAVLAEVKLPSDREFLRRYPHQLSGGQQQRIAIAMAFMLRPKVIVLDEPTTGLDVTTQAHVLATIRELCQAHGVAALYVTHDLAVVADLAQRVLVAYAGRLVESASQGQLFTTPGHPYTRRLLATMPVISERRSLDPIPGHAPSPGQRPGYCFFAPRCPSAASICHEQPTPYVEVGPEQHVLCIRAHELPPAPARGADHPARPAVASEQAMLAVTDLRVSYGAREILHGVSMGVRSHECLALVGESGSGKTTLARSIIGLAPDWSGSVTYAGQALAPRARDRPASIRREVQYIFQSPYTSLNPRRTVGATVAAPLEHFFGLKGQEARQRVDEVLESVSLPARYAARYPDQLSGGERQRVAIARALICEPEIIICDEITSALDVSVQASIVRLLEDLQRERGLALLFVTHNLALVRTLADRVIVMREGEIVEAGDTEQVFERPASSYTRLLLEETPALDRAGTESADGPAMSWSPPPESGAIAGH